MRSAKEPKPLDETLLKEALEVIRKRFSDDCTITSSVRLSKKRRRNVIGRIFIHSPSGAAPASVILKQSLPVTSEQVNDKRIEEENARTFERFSRDWAGLEFVTGLKQDIHNVPQFYDANTKHRFILIEDLGDPHVSLVDSLISPNRENAVAALERYMKALGSFHAAGYKHTEEYEAVLRAINPEAQTTQDELKMISTDLPSRLSEVLAQDKLGLNFSEACQSEMRHVLNGILNSGPFTVLTHGDIAPDNVFDHQNERGLQLIDFENCAVRNALLDGVYLRMSIPTGWCAKAIPQEIIEHTEKIYRDELCKAIPDAKDDKLYNLAYTQACAFHVLMQLTAINSCLDSNEIWKGPVMEGSLWDAQTNFLRPRFLSRLQTFIDVATTNNLYPALTDMATKTLDRIKAIWPDAKPLDAYPAFTSVSLQADAASSRSSTTAILMERGVADKSSSMIIKSEDVRQQSNSGKAEKSKVKPRDAVEQAPVGLNEASTRPSTPFDSIQSGPKPRGFDEKK